MAKTNRPMVENPLAGMGLDDIVRGITTTGSVPAAPEVEEEEVQVPDNEEKEVVAEENKSAKVRRGNMKLFEENLKKYTGISEQGVAVWMPKEVKKRLEKIRVNSDRNLPLRSLAAAIIMTYIAENEDKLNAL